MCINKKVMGKRVSRKDVAEAAGVSETIVSYVLNGNRYVKEEKRQRVLDAVEKLQYQPNNIARALHGKGSLQILFVAEEMSSGYFSQMVSRMSRDAYEQGYMISLCESQKEDEFVSRVISRQFDGLCISASAVTDRQLQMFSASGIPMVILLNREIKCELTNAVFVETGLYEGSRNCTRYVISSGCRNLVYLDEVRESKVTDLHYQGFLDEVKKSGLKFSEKYRISGCKSINEAEEKLCYLLKENPEIDAVISRSDVLAASALHAAEKNQRKIPQDLSVTGFDNSLISQYLTPPLTTVEIQKEEVGKTAIKALLSLIRNENTGKVNVFDARLVIRESTINK